MGIRQDRWGVQPPSIESGDFWLRGGQTVRSGSTVSLAEEFLRSGVRVPTAQLLNVQIKLAKGEKFREISQVVENNLSE